jgi:Ni2+-binding GTPase involved in maturation of urease and hydrogenase
MVGRSQMASPVLFACVGGFLGAGKTSAIVAAARVLRMRGVSVGVVVNDQGHDLVDTAVFSDQGLPAAEIAGGCFCCRFDDLLAAADRLLGDTPVDVLLAEAVGSCTDLVATVYRPLRRFFPDRFRLAPFSVLVEPERVREMRGEGALVPDDVAYLFGRQIAEAELLVLTKLDLVEPGRRNDLKETVSAGAPGVPLLEVSSVTGAGVAVWVDHLLGNIAPVMGTLEVDYDAYARGEAALGWLNATLDIRRRTGLGVRQVGEALIDELGARARRGAVFLPHAKILVASSRGSARIAMTHAEAGASWSGDPDLPPETALSAIVNARAAMPPQALRALVEDSVAAAGLRLGAEVATLRLECFSPPRPVPRHRLAEAPPANGAA